MLLCVLCSSDIPSDYQYYQCNDIGPEIISTIENAFGHEVEEDDTICEDCFGNILQTISQGSGRTSSHEDYELQYPHDQNVCVVSKFDLQKAYSPPARP
ncbi:hypothetical protein ABMA27_007818 [Loxostege sticticalis]|uniref:Uncharacterized protein n=1 Tax=Loxostege sticticalis TaxID=481309 RepID=A0ABR3HD39_LOXSC